MHVGQTRIYRKRVIALALAASLAACASMDDTQRRTAAGAGIGAVTGAVLGKTVGGGGNATRNAALGGAAAGALGGYVWSRQMEEQKRTMEQATQGTGVAVTQTADNRLKLDVPSDVSFDVGRADIKPAFRPVLDRFAQTLTQNPGTGITIIGHTDSTGSDAINDPLSIERADSARDYLVARGVDSRRIVIDGRGAREPVATNATEQGRSRNRRIEVYVAEPVAQAPMPASGR